MATRLLVTGAAGHLGRRVIEHLLETHHVAPGELVAGSRTPEKLAALQARGIDVRKLDFEDSGTFPAAFRDVTSVLLISTDATGQPGRRLSQHEAAVSAAQRAGVTHIVYTSMLNPDNSVIPFAPDHFGTEQALKASGIRSTILRNSWYMENMFMSLPAILASGKWYTAAGSGRVSHVSREDCARAAAAALISRADSSARFDITGPQALTTEEVAALASEALGKPIEVIQVSDATLQQGMIAHGLPEPMASLLTAFDTNTRLGKVDIVTNAVEQLTGSAAKSLGAFLNENRAAFATAS